MSGVSVKPIELTEQEFEEIKTKYDTCYATPWTDRAFKRVFRADNNASKEMVSDFLSALLNVEFPDKKLTVREVKLENDVVNSEQQDSHSFLSSPEVASSETSAASGFSCKKPQNLFVDALYSGIIDGFFKSDASVNVFILVEMQSSKMEFGVRLMQYVSSVVNQQKINLRQDEVPPPVLGTGLCMWNVGAFTLGGKMDSAELDNPDGEVKRRTAMYARNIFLNKPISYGAANEKRLAAREAVKKMVVAHFNKQSYDELSKEEKDVYEWLEFLSCGHIMKTSDVDNLKNKHVKKAYEMNELKYSDRARIYEEHPDLYTDFVPHQQRIKWEQEQQKLEQAVKWYADKLVNTAEGTKFSDIPPNFREDVLTELRSRHVDVSQYEKETEQAKTRPSTTKE